MIREKRGGRSNKMIGRRPSIYRSFFNEFKKQLMVTKPRACETLCGPPLSTVFCRAAGCMVYGTIFSEYDIILYCILSLLPSINVASQTKGVLTQFQGVALVVALNWSVYSLLNDCVAKSFEVRRFGAKDMSINVAETVTKLTEDNLRSR